MVDKTLTLLIGIGNAYRCDDGVGLWVAGRLRERNISGLVSWMRPVRPPR